MTVATPGPGRVKRMGGRRSRHRETEISRRVLLALSPTDRLPGRRSAHLAAVTRLTSGHGHARHVGVRRRQGWIPVVIASWAATASADDVLVQIECGNPPRTAPSGHRAAAGDLRIEKTGFENGLAIPETGRVGRLDVAGRPLERLDEISPLVDGADIRQ